jgi:hypothetical protein
MNLWEDAEQRVLDLVQSNRGEYTRIELIRELRLSYIDDGLDDPKLKKARTIVQDMIESGKITEETPEHSQILNIDDKRCYPTL